MPEIITTGEIQFSDPQTILVRDLQVGDFIVALPAQQFARGYRWNSAVTEISEPGFYGWRLGPPRRKVPIKSRMIRMASVDGRFDVPAYFEVIVRRPEGVI